MFPVGRWRQHQSRVWNSVDPGELLLAEQDGGHPALRRTIALLACGSRGIPTSDDRVVVCSGVRTAVEIAVRSVAEPGARVVMESPGDPEMADRLRRAGYGIISVEVDEEGLRTADLPAAAEAVIVSTALHMATGSSLSAQRRSELLDWAGQVGAELIELDCEGHLARSAGKPVLPLGAVEAVGRSIYIRDFDRVTYPGLSLAFAMFPASLADAARKLVRVVDRPLSVADQLVLADFIGSGGMARHIRDIACTAQAARDALLADLLPHQGSLFDRVSAGGSVLRLQPRQELSQPIANALEESGLVVWAMRELSLQLPTRGDELGIATLGPAVDGLLLRRLADAGLTN
jgi:GntR family transcriptional regulator / MocR family aminotransferase